MASPGKRVVASRDAAVRRFATLGLALHLAAAAGTGAEVRLPDLSGNLVNPFSSSGLKAVVFVFISAECPISNRYAPEVRRLYETFSKRGVSFWLVYPLGDEGVRAIAKHLKDFRYPPRALRDPEHELVKLSGVRVTPEAAVYVLAAEGPRQVYRGRIDDQYVDFGKWRRQPTTRDLEEVLEAVLSGAAAEPKTTTAIGCFIPDPK
jgi:hypothetical protein